MSSAALVGARNCRTSPVGNITLVAGLRLSEAVWVDRVQEVEFPMGDIQVYGESTGVSIDRYSDYIPSPGFALDILWLAVVKWKESEGKLVLRRD